MKIGDENFNKAVKIISTYRSESVAAFNVPINDSYLDVYPIVLKKACPGLVNALIGENFTVGVCDKGAYVEKL